MRFVSSTAVFGWEMVSWNSVPATSGRSVTPKQAKYSSASKSARPLMLKAPDYAASSGPSKLALHAVSASDEVASIFFGGGLIMLERGIPRFLLRSSVAADSSASHLIAPRQSPIDKSSLIASWTNHFLVSSPSPIYTSPVKRPSTSWGGSTRSQGGAVAFKAGGKTALPAGASMSKSSSTPNLSVFGMSSTDYTYSKRRDPALNARIQDLVAARPSTSHGPSQTSKMNSLSSDFARLSSSDINFAPPSTASSQLYNPRLTKEQQAETIKRLATQINKKQYSPKQKSTYDMKRHGKQILWSKFESEKMSAVRNRQKQYTRQLDQSAGNKISLQIDSVTRAVVQQFRKLINSERCALFLHDAETNELYFKPVAGLDTSVSEIRFPATAGIAGWVATKGKMLNIPNAYKDDRFNPDIDKKTGFHTRSILCMPVTEPDGSLLGVCQMVNKFQETKASATSLSREASVAKKYVPFSGDDEDMLKKCCDRVAEALSALRKLQKDAIQDSKKRRKEELNKNLTGDRQHRVTPGGKAGTQSRELYEHALNARTEVKSLINFMSSEAHKIEETKKQKMKKEAAYGSDAGISEAMTHFNFRDIHGPQITSKGQTLDAAEKREANNKAKRQKAYAAQVQDVDEQQAVMNAALRNLMSEFKSMLHCERCGLFFVDDETDELYFHVEEEGQHIRFPKSKGIAGEACITGKPLLIPDAYKDPRFNKNVDKITGFRTRNILCQPVFDQMGEVIAIMQMVNSDRDTGFTVAEQERLGKFGQKMSQGLLAIRDSKKDGTSQHLQQSRMAKIEHMKGIISEIHKQIDEEKKAYFAKRKQESRHEYTANEAAARFKFRDGKGDVRKEEHIGDEDGMNLVHNKKLMEDIFSGKGIEAADLESGHEGQRSRRPSMSASGSRRPSYSAPGGQGSRRNSVSLNTSMQSSRRPSLGTSNVTTANPSTNTSRRNSIMGGGRGSKITVTVKAPGSRRNSVTLDNVEFDMQSLENKLDSLPFNMGPPGGVSREDRSRRASHLTGTAGNRPEVRGRRNTQN